MLLLATRDVFVKMLLLATRAVLVSTTKRKNIVASARRLSRLVRDDERRRRRCREITDAHPRLRLRDREMEEDTPISPMSAIPRHQSAVREIDLFFRIHVLMN